MTSSALRPPASKRDAAHGGFVLLEVLMALVIFTVVVLAWARASDNALEAAYEANTHRTLRMLTAFKLSEVRAKPAEFWEGGDGGFDAEIASFEENPFADYRWEVEAQEVSAAGHCDDDDVEHVYSLDEDDVETTSPSSPDPGSGPGSGQESKPAECIRLLRLTLTVTWVPEGGDLSEKMSVVTWVDRPEEMVEESEQ